jgi:two-component system, NtrC family, response regulator AtoC
MENILIVDDEEQIVNVISQMVKKWGYNPIQASSGAKALEKIRSMPVDLVISDLMMPRMDGITLVEKIMEIDNSIMIMMLTGYPSIDSAVQAIKAGAYDYMVKPVKADELKLKIEKCLEKKYLLRSKSLLKGLNWALIISIPFWLVLGIILAGILRRFNFF